MTKQVRLLILMDRFAGKEGGTEQHILFLLRSLPTFLTRVHFALLGDGQELCPTAFPLEPFLISPHKHLPIWAAAQRLRRLAHLIRSLEVDVVHTFDPTSEAYALVAVRLAGRGKVLGSRRNIGHWHTRASLWRTRVLRVLGAQYVANCQATKDFAVRHEWISESRIAVVPNPAPYWALLAAQSSVMLPALLGVPPGEHIVAMVATVRPIKDYSTFLRAARLVLNQHPNTRFLAIGGQDPQYLSELENLSEELGISGQVYWTGPVDNSVSVLKHCDVGVLSSQSEGLSNALLDYAVAGIATVATDVGGNREVVEQDVTGFLVPARSPEALADRICQLLCDGALREAFGRRAALRVRNVVFRRQNPGTVFATVPTAGGKWGSAFRRGSETDSRSRALDKQSVT